MSKVKLTGESSGYVEISAGDAAGNNTLELPTSGVKIVGSDHANNVDNLGVVTATKFVGDLEGGVNSISNSGSVFNTNVGVQTATISGTDLVGAGNSFVGLYIGDGSLFFSSQLNNSNGYYITTSINALNAGPVTLGSTMTLDGTWVIV
tara:strand:- start:1096 stop:1542 length:447 start_codon:yes stop_codon:yes gene_type:complete